MSEEATADKKQRIMEVAARLFADKGFDGVSVREIAEEADVTKPVIYYYFKNKQDLFQSLLDTAFAHVSTMHEEIYREDRPVGEKLRMLIRGHFQFCQENPDVVKLLFDDMRERISDKSLDSKSQDLTHKNRFRRISEFIRDGQQQGVFREGVDAVKVGMLFIGTTNMFILYQLHSDKNVISSAVADELVDIILHGIAIPNHQFQEE